MTYKEYIDRGFVRTDLDDNVRLNETGYGGFTLQRKYDNFLTVAVTDGELDSPKLYFDNGDYSCIIGKFPVELVRFYCKTNEKLSQSF